MMPNWTTYSDKTTMKKELKIIEQLKQRAKELIPIDDLEIKIKVEKPIGNKLMPDLIMHVAYSEFEFDLAGEIIAQNSSSLLKAKIAALRSYVNHDKDLVPVVIAEYFSPERREQCRDEGVYYLDLSGNVFIKHKSLYIERIGFPNLYPEKRKGRGVFSDKASIILREAFKNIKKQWGVRELARSIGLDPGFVSRMARELEKKNYISRKDSKIIFKDPESILKDWVHEYDYKKNKEVRFFCLSKGPSEIVEKVKRLKIPEKIKYALGFHAGANLLSPYAVYNEVHIYIRDKESIKWYAKKLELREVEEGANLVFLLPFYKHSVFYDIQKVERLNIVSDLQLYLDLYKYPIRGIEQAEHIHESRLKNFLKG
jgi:DNA-binding transcriptional regulator YhcF (GntR family)